MSDHETQRRYAAISAGVPHYYLGRSGAPIWETIEDFGLNFNVGSVVSYLVRAGRKTPDPLEDLKKARNFLEREIQCAERGLRK